MAADLPWMNQYFGEWLGTATDDTPLPYRYFYTSLSIASTYLLPLATIAAVSAAMGAVAYFCEGTRETLKNIAGFLYSCVVAGLSFAGAACVQGILLNPV
jgi:hypothetical protein